MINEIDKLVFLEFLKDLKQIKEKFINFEVDENEDFDNYSYTIKNLADESSVDLVVMNAKSQLLNLHIYKDNDLNDKEYIFTVVKIIHVDEKLFDVIFTLADSYSYKELLSSHYSFEDNIEHRDLLDSYDKLSFVKIDNFAFIWDTVTDRPSTMGLPLDKFFESLEFHYSNYGITSQLSNFYEKYKRMMETGSSNRINRNSDSYLSSNNGEDGLLTKDELLQKYTEG